MKKETALILIMSLLIMGVSGCPQTSSDDLTDNAEGEEVSFFPPSELDSANIGKEYEYSLCGRDVFDSSGDCDGGIGTKIYGSNKPFTFSITNNSKMPDGLILHENGFIDGIPTKLGKTDFRVCIEDEEGYHDCNNVSISVR